MIERPRKESGRLHASRWQSSFPALLEDAISHRRAPRQIAVQTIAKLLVALTEGAGIEVSSGCLDLAFGRWIRRQMNSGALVPTLKTGVLENKMPAPDVRFVLGVYDLLHKKGGIVPRGWELQERPRQMSAVSQPCVDSILLDIWACESSSTTMTSPEVSTGFDVSRPVANEANHESVVEAPGVMTWMGQVLGDSANDASARRPTQRRR